MVVKSTRGTFNRSTFFDSFAAKVIPKLNPWPLPNSIVVMDNAKIHLFKELESSIHQCGARLLFLPPYSPQLNPIETSFGKLKKRIQKRANLVFRLYPGMVLEVAMRRCTEATSSEGEFLYCGYDEKNLHQEVFDTLCEVNMNHY